MLLCVMKKLRKNPMKNIENILRDTEFKKIFIRKNPLSVQEGL